MSIIVNNLTFTYMKNGPFEKKAIDDISFEIQSGEFVGIIGHTGSGKSTLIQHFNGLLKPESGSVIIDGIDVSQKDLKQLRNNVGLVFQYPEHQLFEETVYKDIAFGPTKQGLSDKEIKERVHQALKGVGLSEDILTKSPFELSGGQKRRVAIAGVLSMKPSILVLDEPTAGLDPAGKDEIFSYINEIHTKNKMTTILVSHSMEDIAKLVDRVIVLNKGKIYKDGKPEDIFFDAEGLKKIGLSVPQITLLMKKMKNDCSDIDDRIFTVDNAVKELFKILKRKEI